MSAIREWFKGKKTYIVAIAAALAAVLGWAQGEMELPELAEALVVAILAMTVRAGVTTAAKGG